jgi:hypothetical protein
MVGRARASRSPDLISCAGQTDTTGSVEVYHPVALIETHERVRYLLAIPTHTQRDRYGCTCHEAPLRTRSQGGLSKAPIQDNHFNLKAALGTMSRSSQLFCMRVSHLAPQQQPAEPHSPLPALSHDHSPVKFAQTCASRGIPVERYGIPHGDRRHETRNTWMCDFVNDAIPLQSSTNVPC